MAADPTRVLVAGDWHGNTDWAVGVIEQMPHLLPDEDPRIVLHAGDFGIWPGRAGQDFVDDVAVALLEANAVVWFVDGNHDDHAQLGEAFAALGRDRTRTVCGWESWGVPNRIAWLPRGYRWTWHGRTWLALGGATSVDRAARVRGRTWWPGERISGDDIDAAAGPGRADVMLTHDCPAGVPLDLPRPAPHWWDIADADRHRTTLRGVVDLVQPSHVIHGHYHLAHQTTVALEHGDVEITGLNSDGATHGAHRVVDVQTMAWEMI